MAGLFTLNELTAFSEPEEREYVSAPLTGMTPDALFNRYLYLQDACVEAERDLGYAGDYKGGSFDAYLTKQTAKLHSVASIAFLPVPVLPFFPWKAPVR